VDAHRSIALVAGPYVKHRAVVSQYFTTVSMLRTIEDVLGIKPLGLNDAFQLPMAAVFSVQEMEWTYTARMPSILRTTQLPLPAPNSTAQGQSSIPAHDAAYWAEKTKDFDFTVEDKLDSENFNLVLWRGLKGESEPYPSERDGRDLSKHRDALLRELRKSKNQ